MQSSFFNGRFSSAIFHSSCEARGNGKENEPMKKNCLTESMAPPKKAKTTTTGAKKKKKETTFSAEQVVALVNEKTKVASKKKASAATRKKKVVGVMKPAPARKKTPAKNKRQGLLGDTNPTAIGIAVRSAVEQVMK